jgi:predicted kinase
VPDNVPVLALVAGLPGAGKTTYASELEDRLQAVRLGADDWLDELAIELWDADARERVEGLQWRLARRLLQRGVSVVIEWGTWTRAERTRIAVEGRRLGARVELHYLDAPDEVLHRRVADREREHPAITREQLEGWRLMFEVPDEDEAQHWDDLQVVRSQPRH